VDKSFALQAFEFSLDPGTGPVEVRGRIEGLRLTLDVKTPSGTRSEVRQLEEPPALSQNISRRLANGGLVPGAKHQWTVFDPATLRNSKSERRSRQARGSCAAPAPRPFRRSAWRWSLPACAPRRGSPDTGEVVREESPLGLITVREFGGQRAAMACSRRMQVDLLSAAAVEPRNEGRRSRSRATCA